MAHGQPDFLGAIQPVMPVYGTSQTAFYLAEDGDIAGLSFADFVESIVPPGYELHFMGGAIGSDFPGTTKYATSIMGVPVAVGFFDTGAVIPLHPAAAIIVPPLYTVSLRIYNDDADAHHYAALAIGFFVEKGA